MQKCDFNLYSFVNMLHDCSRTPLLENTSGELLLHIVLNIEVTNEEVLSKQVKKLFEIHFSVINTFSDFKRDFCLVAKG